ncbi:hypothetical protein HA466_0204710 [Hirschfeldia incana]|nr:hypothetical protein HA466_0204710 [Hirschfeldia incana]
MAGQVPSVVSCSWSPSSTHVLYHCVCHSEIDARVFRSGSSLFHINGSPVKPVIKASIEGDKFHTSVTHCNFAVNITCDGSSTRVSVDPTEIRSLL